MSRQLLSSLNGNKNGQLKKFIDNFEGEPRIAWYPSAGEDFRAMLYLHPNYSILNPATEQEPAAPDIFLFTDYFPWEFSRFLDKNFVYGDSRTSVIIESIEELPNLMLPLHSEIVDFIEGSKATDRAVFMKIRINSDRLGKMTIPVIYAFAENEAFCAEKLLPNHAILSHIVHVRYGGGCGGGGKASGIWLLNVLEKLQCEMYVTDTHYNWQQGDLKALELYPIIPVITTAKLISIRTISGISWSGHGDVSFNLVS